eukprot:767133-Hanusia_phi.AAC.3
MNMGIRQILTLSPLSFWNQKSTTLPGTIYLMTKIYDYLMVIQRKKRCQTGQQPTDKSSMGPCLQTCTVKEFVLILVLLLTWTGREKSNDAPMVANQKISHLKLLEKIQIEFTKVVQN